MTFYPFTTEIFSTASIFIWKKKNKVCPTKNDELATRTRRAGHRTATPNPQISHRNLAKKPGKFVKKIRRPGIHSLTTVYTQCTADISNCCYSRHHRISPAPPSLEPSREFSYLLHAIASTNFWQQCWSYIRAIQKYIIYSFLNTVLPYQTCLCLIIYNSVCLRSRTSQKGCLEILSSGLDVWTCRMSEIASILSLSLFNTFFSFLCKSLRISWVQHFKALLDEEVGHQFQIFNGFDISTHLTFKILKPFCMRSWLDFELTLYLIRGRELLKQWVLY